MVQKAKRIVHGYKNAGIINTTPAVDSYFLTEGFQSIINLNYDIFYIDITQPVLTSCLDITLTNS